jgi:Cu+-exporting ATPase
MDVLVSLGTNASYAYSIISVLHHHWAGHHASGAYRPTDFFETSAMLITFILLGKYLEASAKGRTSEAIRALLTLTPPSAILLIEEEQLPGSGGEAGGKLALAEREVPTALIHRGDLLKVGRLPLVRFSVKTLAPRSSPSGHGGACNAPGAT